MNKIVVDTNIVFSALLNINSKIGQILIRGSKFYEFYSPSYISFEILKHKSKIKKLGRLNEKQFNQTLNLITKNIIILNHSVIPQSAYLSSEKICKSIDLDDTIFVAFTDYLNAKLWTGDKKLFIGLTEMGFDKVINTEDLYIDFMNRLNSN